MEPHQALNKHGIEAFDHSRTGQCGSPAPLAVMRMVSCAVT